MRQAVTVSLPESLGSKVDAICRADGVSRSELVQEALRRLVRARELEEVRRSLMPYAEAAGLVTDDDMFREIS